MSSIIITGASRGLGLEFSRQYARDGWRVFACCRDPRCADDLHGLGQQYDNLSVHGLDVADHRQIDGLAQELSDQTLDVLLSNAGVYAHGEAERFGQLDYDVWVESFQVNTLAAAKLAEAFVTQLTRGQRPLIVAISTLMASIEDNGSGGSYLYRSSKAALNATMKSLSIDLKPRGIGVLILHPGWVRTALGGPNGLIDTPESVGGMRALMEDFMLGDSGRFIDYQGQELPW